MLKRNLVSNFMGQAWNAAMSFAFIPVYIHYLGIESYGLIGLFALVMAWTTLLDMGLTPTISREMARFVGGEYTPELVWDLLRSVETVTFGIAAIIAFGLTVASSWLASYWLHSNTIPLSVVSQTITIIGFVSAFRFAETIYHGSLVGLQRQTLLNLIKSSVATLSGLGCVAVLAWFSPTIQAFFLWQGIVSVISLVTLGVAVHRVLPTAVRQPRFSLTVLRSVWGFASGMLGITFLALLLTQVDKILLSRLLSLKDYGHYTLASVVASSLYMFVAPIAQAWFPRLTQLYASKNIPELVETYHRGSQLVSIGMGSASIIFMVFGEVLLQVWTQNTELAERTAPLLVLLSLGNLLNGLMYIPYQTQLAFGWTSLSLRINTISVMFIVPSLFLATRYYGPMGAAFVWSALNAGYLLIGVHFMYRRILVGEKWRWYVEDIVFPLLSGLCVAFGIRWLLPQDRMGIVQQIALLLLASTCTVFATVLAARNIRGVFLATFLRLMNSLSKAR